VAPRGRLRLSRGARATAAALERLVPALPGALDVPIAELIGTIAYLAAPAARAAVRANLAVVAPDRPRRERLVRKTFVFQVRHYLETFRLVRWSAARVIASVEVSGWEHFLAARERAAGGAVVLASAHLGPIPLSGQYLLARGYAVTLPVEPETTALARALNHARTSMGLRLVETDSALSLGRVLRQDGVLGLLVDRAVTGVGERVPFFGREALLPSAHVAIALRTGAPLLPAFTRREGRRLVATVEPPLELVRTGDHAADVRRGVRQFASVMERHIRMAPEQWSVFEAIWER